MPTYQYACRQCDEGFEKKLRMSQAGDAQECPTCGSMDTRKVIGGFAIGANGSARQERAPRPVSSPFS